MTAPRPFLAYDRNSPEAKGARILDRIGQARALRSTPAAAPAAEPFIAPANPWDVLSPSSVNEFQDCNMRWYYRKVLELPETRTAALALGTAVHATLAENFRQKIATGRDLPIADVRARFRVQFAHELETAAMQDGDEPADLENAGEVMTSVYMEQAAPEIQPAAVELPVSGKIGDVHARGFVDVLDVNGMIIDFKTAGKKPSAISPSHRLQLATYAMITPRASGRTRLDTLTKTRTVSLTPQTMEVTEADRRYTERLYAITRDQMQSGVYAPNRSSFLCSKKHCGFASICQAEYGGVIK